MQIFNYKYLSQDQLRRLDSYKYAAIDTSPLSTYVMHPFWNYVVEFVPMSVAPNLLTLAGFACTLMNAFLLSYYDYNFFASSDDSRSVTGSQPVPPIVWLICAINLFLAHTLDGIDGKQARRTKATGPLGELMDHGVDSWTALFVPLYIYSLFGSSDYSFGPQRMFFVFWSVFLTFYVTHWEKYITGVLYLPWNYDVSQIFLFICSIATYLGSHQVWKSTFPFTDLPYSYTFEFILYGCVVYSVEINLNPITYLAQSIFISLPLPIYNVIMTCKSGKSKYSAIRDIVGPLAPFTLLFAVSTIWALYSRNDVLAKDPRVYFYMVGTIFSNISCRLIVCQMSSSKGELVNGLTVLLSLVAFAAISFPFAAATELFVMRFLAFVITIAHIHYAVCVVQQMCDHLKINALSLAKRDAKLSRRHSTKDSASNTMYVIISGGSKGIGKSIAKLFAELGAHVTIIARNENDLLVAKEEIEQHRKNTRVQRVRTVSLDLTTVTFPNDSKSDISKPHKELLDKILGEHGRCDVLINCCGSATPARFEDISQQQFNYMMQVNYYSAVNLTRLLLPVMKSRSLANQGSSSGGGRIVFVSSMCGLMSFFGYSAYSASKFALVGLAEALNMELKPFNIGVTISFPPDTDTPGYEEENKTKPKVTSDISKTGSLYSPDEVAKALMQDIKAKRFYSTVGLENWLVLMASNAFMPSSFGRVLVESFLAGPLKLISYFILRSWYKIVDNGAANEVIRSEIALKCSKKVMNNGESQLKYD